MRARRWSRRASRHYSVHWTYPTCGQETLGFAERALGIRAVPSVEGNQLPIPPRRVGSRRNRGDAEAPLNYLGSGQGGRLVGPVEGRRRGVARSFRGAKELPLRRQPRRLVVHARVESDSRSGNRISDVFVYGGGCVSRIPRCVRFRIVGWNARYPTFEFGREQCAVVSRHVSGRPVACRCRSSLRPVRMIRRRRMRS